MSVLEYSEDVGLDIKEILELCKKLNIKASNENDMLDEDAIIMLDNEIANGSESDNSSVEEEEYNEFVEEEVIEDKAEELAQSNKWNNVKKEGLSIGIVILIVLISAIVCLVVGIVIGQFITKKLKEKKRANELDENYDYESPKENIIN